MKKYAIVIIGLVFAALVFGSCGGEVKGGTIKVKNEYKGELPGGGTVALPVKITITSIIPFVSKSGQIPADGEKSFALDEDGTYTVAIDLTDPVAILAGVKVSPSSVTLKGGNTVKVTLKQ